MSVALVAAVATQPVFGQVARQNAPAMATAPGGVFAMGAADGGSWEGPVHQVRTPDFQISARPVSNAEFRAFRPDHKSSGDAADSAPVTGVSWDDAQAYCAWLSAQTGRQFVLPTEAWWERAARGGIAGAKYPWGAQPVPDGTERRNPFGVFAVSYNLWEWTADWYSGDYYASAPQDNPRGPAEGVYRVLRGGGYRNDPASATVYTRGSARPETRSERITFRVASAGGAAPSRPQISSAAPAPKPAAPAPRPAARPSPPPQASSTAAGPGGPVDVAGVSFAEEAGAIVIKIQTSAAARFKAFALKAPDRLVVDVLDGTATLRPVTGNVSVGRGSVKSVRYSQFQASPPIFRAVIDLDQALDYRVEAWDSELRVRLQPK